MMRTYTIHIYQILNFIISKELIGFIQSTHLLNYTKLTLLSQAMPFKANKVKVLGVVFMNKFGAKIYSKFYLKHTETDFAQKCSAQFDVRTELGQQKTAKEIYRKICKMNVANEMTNQPERSQILSFFGYTALFKVVHELVIILICEQDENYVLMESVINCIGNTLLLLTQEKYVQKTIEENLDGIVLAVDEIFDEGLIMCLDQGIIYDRLKMKQGAEKGQSQGQQIQQKRKENEQKAGGFGTLFGMAKNSLSKTLNFG